VRMNAYLNLLPLGMSASMLAKVCFPPGPSWHNRRLPNGLFGGKLRYHGVFASRSSWHRLLTPKPPRSCTTPPAPAPAATTVAVVIAQRLLEQPALDLVHHLIDEARFRVQKESPWSVEVGGFERALSTPARRWERLGRC